jgi:hypothetical protein
MIRVPVLSWFKSRYGGEFGYPQFFNGFEEVPMPSNSKYFAGDVVIITEDGKEVVGVVLGVIDNVREDLRTDACGMVSFSSIRPVKTMKELKSYTNVADIVNCLDAIKRNTKRRMLNMKEHLASLK